MIFGGGVCTTVGRTSSTTVCARSWLVTTVTSGAKLGVKRQMSAIDILWPQVLSVPATGLTLMGLSDHPFGIYAFATTTGVSTLGRPERAGNLGLAGPSRPRQAATGRSVDGERLRRPT